MRTDERDAQPNQGPKRFSLMTHVVIVLGLISTLVIILIAWNGCNSPERAKITKCKNALNQLGICIQSYYSDGTSTAMPVLHGIAVTSNNNGGLFFDANMLSCPAMHHGLCLDYLWNPKLSGGKWSEWSNRHSPLIWDASPHKITNKVNVLFGDGHVEEMTPERLKELTR
jgi:prepilin-type processing-associated H-X9-DG protein